MYWLLDGRPGSCGWLGLGNWLGFGGDGRIDGRLGDERLFLRRLGLVVIGYSGWDQSVMDTHSAAAAPTASPAMVSGG